MYLCIYVLKNKNIYIYCSNKIFMTNITLIKLETVQLYLDISKKIIFVEVLSSSYSKEEFITLFEYFQNFWILAKEQNVKYYLVTIVNNVGISFEFLYEFSFIFK